MGWSEGGQRRSGSGPWDGAGAGEGIREGRVNVGGRRVRQCWMEFSGRNGAAASYVHRFSLFDSGHFVHVRWVRDQITPRRSLYVLRRTTSIILP
jgi:hypothetical protein